MTLASSGRLSRATEHTRGDNRMTPHEGQRICDKRTGRVCTFVGEQRYSLGRLVYWRGRQIEPVPKGTLYLALKRDDWEVVE